MTAAVLSGVFQIKQDAEVRELPSGEMVVTLALAYAYGGRKGDGTRRYQSIEAGIFGPRASKMAPRLLKGALVFATVEDVHVEDYASSTGTEGHKLSGRLGRIDLVADPKMSGLGRREKDVHIIGRRFDASDNPPF